MIFAFVWCLTAAILATVPVLAVDRGNSSQADEIYRTIQKEKKSIIMKTMDGFMAKQKSCNNLCGESRSEREENKCHCDKQCVDFGDCCLDYWARCNASFSQAYKHERTFECVMSKLRLSANTTLPKNPRYIGYENVIKCPKTFQNLRIKNACEKPEQDNENVLPFVQGKNGRTYRNQFCAECNGVSEFKQWNTTLRCSDETKMLIKRRVRTNNYTFTYEERQQIRETCEIELAPPFGVKGALCRIVTECEDHENADYWACKLYKQQLYPVTVPYKAYKNPHCARCSGEYLILLQSNEAHIRTPKPSLGILFDFTKSSQIYGLKEVTTEHTCKAGEIYDHQRKTCRQQRILENPVSGHNWTCAYYNETFPNSSEHIVIYNNRSIFVAAHEKMYKPGEYFWHLGNITVCGNLTVTYLKSTLEKLTNLYTKTEFYITVIGLSLSILALLAVIFTYFLFSELRSKLPGKIVINLAIALMLAQLVFLVDMFSDVEGKGCVTIAVSLQFLYLAAFCWMNVMAFDVSRTFAGKSHRTPSGSRNKVFMLCLFYAWGIPLMITGLTLIINYTGAMNVAYGNNYYCWITNPVALAIFFVAPVVIMLLFNIIALVRVLVAVRQVRKVTKKVRDTSTAAQDARMCWKLTAVFGLTWILCVAAEHHIALRIIYIIFNSLQGVFIMFGFIMTKRVLNMYLTKAGKKPLSTTTRSTQKSTLSRSEVTRKTSSVPLVERKSFEKRRDPTEQAVKVVNNEDSPEAVLIASMEGPETKL